MSQPYHEQKLGGRSQYILSHHSAGHGPYVIIIMYMYMSNHRCETRPSTTQFCKNDIFLQIDVKSYLFDVQTAEQGADTVLHAALSPELEARGGRYIDNCQETLSSVESYSSLQGDKLWAKSCTMLGI